MRVRVIGVGRKVRVICAGRKVRFIGVVQSHTNAREIEQIRTGLLKSTNIRVY
jgi:hypothetical protein